MDKKIGYTVVAICSTEIQEQFAILKRKLPFLNLAIPKNRKNIILKDTAHFAIKRTFYLKDNVNESVLLSKLKNITFPKIKIKCEQIGTFNNSNYGTIVFAKVKINEELILLHQKIKNSIDDLVVTKNPELEGNNWLPHIAFTYNTSQERILEIKNIMENELLPIEFNLNKIYLLKDFNVETDEREILSDLNS